MGVVSNLFSGGSGSSSGSTKSSSTSTTVKPTVSGGGVVGGLFTSSPYVGSQPGSPSVPKPQEPQKKKRGLLDMLADAAKGVAGGAYQAVVANPAKYVNLLPGDQSKNQLYQAIQNPAQVVFKKPDSSFQAGQSVVSGAQRGISKFGADLVATTAAPIETTGRYWGMKILRPDLSQEKQDEELSKPLFTERVAKYLDKETGSDTQRSVKEILKDPLSAGINTGLLVLPVVGKLLGLGGRALPLLERVGGSSWAAVQGGKIVPQVPAILKDINDTPDIGLKFEKIANLTGNFALLGLAAYGGVKTAKEAPKAYEGVGLKTEKTVAGGKATVSNETARDFFNKSNPNIDEVTNTALTNALRDNKTQFVNELKTGGGVTIQNPDVTVPTVYGRILNIIQGKVKEGKPLTPSETTIINDATRYPEKYVPDTRALTATVTPQTPVGAPKVIPYTPSTLTEAPATIPKPQDLVQAPTIATPPSPIVSMPAKPSLGLRIAEAKGNDTLVSDLADAMRNYQKETGGVTIQRKEQAYGQDLMTRESTNPSYYSDFYKQNNRAPSKSDYLELAKAELEAQSELAKNFIGEDAVKAYKPVENQVDTTELDKLLDDIPFKKAGEASKFELKNDVVRTVKSAELQQQVNKVFGDNAPTVTSIFDRYLRDNDALAYYHKGIINLADGITGNTISHELGHHVVEMLATDAEKTAIYKLTGGLEPSADAYSEFIRLANNKFKSPNIKRSALLRLKEIWDKLVYRAKTLFGKGKELRVMFDKIQSRVEVAKPRVPKEKWNTIQNVLDDNARATARNKVESFQKVSKKNKIYQLSPSNKTDITKLSKAVVADLKASGYTGITDGKSIINFEQKKPTTKSSNPKENYGMSHRPTEGSPAHNLLAKVDGEAFAPKDIYDHPEWYANGDGSLADKQSIAAILKIRGKPNAEITVYRASPKNELNSGDWITLSKAYAEQEALTEGVKVNSFKVTAKDVKWAGDSLNEFGYFPRGKAPKASNTVPTKYKFESGGSYDKKDLRKSGFGTEATGFGDLAEIYNINGKPAIAASWQGTMLDGLSVKDSFRRKGVATQFVKELLDEGGGKLKVVDANDDMIGILRKVGNISEPDGSGIITVTSKGSAVAPEAAQVGKTDIAFQKKAGAKEGLANPDNTIDEDLRLIKAENKPDNPTKVVENHQGLEDLRLHKDDQMVKELFKGVGKKEDKQLFDAAITYQKTGDWAGLPDKLKETATRVTTLFDMLGRKALEEGRIQNMRENYITQIWDEQSIDKILRDPSYVGKLTEEQRAFLKNFIGSSTRFGLERVFKNYEEGKAVGLKPKYDKLSDVLKAYINADTKAATGRIFTNELMNLGENKVAPSVSNNPPGWRAVSKISGLRGYSVSPDVYKAIKFYEAGSKIAENRYFNSALKFTQAHKQIQLAGDFYLLGNYIRDSFKPTVFGGFRLIAESRKASPQTMAELQSLGGLQLREYNPETGSTVSKMGKKGKALLNEKKNPYFFPDYLSFKLGDELRNGTAAMVYRQNLKRNMPKAEAAKNAVKFAQNAFGRQNLARLGRDQTFQDIARLAAISPDYTESRLKFIMKGIKGIAPEVKFKGGFKFKGWSRDNIRYTAGLFRYIAIAYGTFALLNQAFAGHMPWQNDPDHQFDLEVKVGDGKKYYVNVLGVVKTDIRFITGLANLTRGDGTDIARFLGNKSSPTLRALESFFTNEDWQGKKIVNDTDQVAEATQKRLANLARTYIPLPFQGLMPSNVNNPNGAAPKGAANWALNSLGFNVYDARTMPANVRSQLDELEGLKSSTMMEVYSLVRQGKDSEAEKAINNFNSRVDRVGKDLSKTASISDVDRQSLQELGKSGALDTAKTLEKARENKDKAKSDTPVSTKIDYGIGGVTLPSSQSTTGKEKQKQIAAKSSKTRKSGGGKKKGRKTKTVKFAKARKPKGIRVASRSVKVKTYKPAKPKTYKMKAIKVS